MSYIVWDQTNLDVVSGNYILPDNVGAEISHTPDYNIGRNFARIFGITGFIIVHKNQDIMFNTEWTGNKFVFILDASRPLIKYLSY